MRPFSVKSGFAATLALLALLTTGCASDNGTGNTQPPENNSVGSPTENPGTENPGNSDNQQQDETFVEEELEGALVSSFPDDIPLYSGDVIASVAALSEVSEAPEWNVTIKTNDPFDTVDEAIRNAYTNNGWEIRTEMDFMGGYMLVTANEKYIVSITYNDLDGSGITINYGVSS